MLDCVLKNGCELYVTNSPCIKMSFELDTKKEYRMVQMELNIACFNDFQVCLIDGEG